MEQVAALSAYAEKLLHDLEVWRFHHLDVLMCTIAPSLPCNHAVHFLYIIMQFSTVKCVVRLP
jgi:hypothetical protein